VDDTSSLFVPVYNGLIIHFMERGNAAWTCSMDMQHEDMDMKHENEA
jgi:hypothetical protein